MLLKDVKAGEVYLVARYGSASSPRTRRRWHLDEQKVPGYSRKGVLMQPVDRGTLEPVTYPDGRIAEPRHMMAVSIVMPWDEFHRGYHELLDEMAEQAELRRIEREREEAAARERNAKAWMEREFARAKADIEQVVQVVWPEGMEFCDDDVRALVDLRNPDGNPYLKDES